MLQGAPTYTCLVLCQGDSILSHVPAWAALACRPQGKVCCVALGCSTFCQPWALSGAASHLRAQAVWVSCWGKGIRGGLRLPPAFLGSLLPCLLYTRKCWNKLKSWAPSKKGVAKGSPQTGV